MKKLLFTLGLTLFCLISNAQTPYYFYNYKGEKVFLSLNTSHAFLSVREPGLPSEFQQRNVRTGRLQSDRSDQKQFQTRSGTRRYYTTLSFDEKMSDEQYLSLLSDIKRENKDVIIAPFFKGNNGDAIGMSNFFYVKLKEERDTTLLRQMTERTGTIVIEQDPFMPLWYVLSTTETAERNAMEYANLFFESGLFQTAEPDLIFNLLQCANDTYFNNQWGLKNTGQYGGIFGIDIKICDAWQIATGSGVTVAIIDQGLELDPFHPDLANTVYSLSYDTETNSSPSVVLGNHGILVAGIVGATRNNSAGISGVAPNSWLMSISNYLTADEFSNANSSFNILQQQNLAAGITWAWQNGAQVINCSWGHELYQGRFIMDAIDSAVTYGRNGLGCVVVVASGNNNASTVSYPANLSNVIAVGAISPCGERKSPTSCDTETGWGSNYGQMLDVVAPGVLISTTDQMGNIGYNPLLSVHTLNGGNKISNDYTDQNYTVWFFGTSAAVPHVSGVAALMLSVNPKLSWKQVRDIIESTAQKVGGYNYQTTSGRPNGTWHEEMGYGLINAHTAVFVAAAMSGAIPISGPSLICGNTSADYSVSNLPSGVQVTWSSSSNITINPTNGVASRHSSVSGTMQPGWIKATITITGQQPIELTKNISVGTVPNANLISSNRNHTSVPFSFNCSFEDFITYNGSVVAPGNSHGITHGQWVTKSGFNVFAQAAELPGVSSVMGAAAYMSVLSSGWAPQQIEARLYNQCGFSSKNIEYYQGNCDPGFCPFCLGGCFFCMGFVFSPNPANDELTIEFTDRFGLSDRQQASITIRLYDGFGILHRQAQFEHSRNNGRPQPITFNVTNLPEGTYYLHIYDDISRQPYMHQIIVERK
jgi:hypothetical protein